MSNWIGLREDQRVGEGLAAEIDTWLSSGLFANAARLEPSHLGGSNTPPRARELACERAFDSRLARSGDCAFASKLALMGMTVLHSGDNVRGLGRCITGLHRRGGRHQGFGDKPDDGCCHEIERSQGHEQG